MIQLIQFYTLDIETIYDDGRPDDRRLYMGYGQVTEVELKTKSMLTSSIGNIFRVTGPLCGEPSSHRWIPFTKASDVELCSACEQTVEQAIDTPVILIMTSLYC